MKLTSESKEIFLNCKSWNSHAPNAFSLNFCFIALIKDSFINPLLSKYSIVLYLIVVSLMAAVHILIIDAYQPSPYLFINLLMHMNNF